MTEKAIVLKEDGTVSGAYTGTWKQGTNGPEVTLKCGGVTYEGVFVEQTVEGSQWPAMCLTVVGDNDISIWGYRIVDDRAAVVKNAGNFDGGIKTYTYGDIQLKTSLPDNVWGEIWSFFDDSQSRLFLTQNAFLGYNEGMVYFDCNNGATVTNAIGKGAWKLVTVTTDQNNFAIYIDGKLKYDKNQYAAYAGSGYDEEMGGCLLYLFNSCSNFYIGYGGFWGSGELSVDNLKIYSKSLSDAEVLRLYLKVTQIGSSAFAGCKKLKKVTIGSNVSKIGKKAFYNCKKLNRITIRSKKITSVGKSALKGIHKKAKIKVPSSKLKKHKKLYKKKGQKKTVRITK